MRLYCRGGFGNRTVSIDAQITHKPMAKIVSEATFAPLSCAWRNRELLRRMIWRDIQARFRGSVFGTFWAGAAPLVKLSAYTLVFGVVIQPRWQDQINDPLLIAFTYFSGLIVFDFFMETVGTASTLMRENDIFIRKVIFPVEILPWVVLGYATFRVVIGMSLLLISYVIFKGHLPPAEIVLIPLFFMPYALIVLGLIWIVSAVGAYVRDIVHVISALLPLLMFISPVFFPLSASPATFRSLLQINPLTFPLEEIRAVLVGNGFHAWFGLVVYTLAAMAVSALGYRFFMRLRPGFADVL